MLFGVDLDVQENEIVALLGTNGAGKSTLFKCVTGLLPAQRGTITFDGNDVTNKDTNDIAADGIVMMPGGKSVFPTLSVRDDEAQECWRVVDAVLAGWRTGAVPLREYPAGSAGPVPAGWPPQ